MVSKVSQILGNFFGNRLKGSAKSSIIESKNRTYTKSSIVETSPESKNKSVIQSRKMESAVQERPSR